jgi:hypothetical protein
LVEAELRRVHVLDSLIACKLPLLNKRMSYPRNMAVAATICALISFSSKPNPARSFAVKVLTLAALLLLPASLAFAQGAAPATPAAAAPAAAAPAAAKPRRAPVAHVARPAQTSPEVQDVSQILGIRQIDPATYEIDARLQNGNEIHLRMNAFVMQGLGMQLGTYGKQ